MKFQSLVAAALQKIVAASKHFFDRKDSKMSAFEQLTLYLGIMLGVWSSAWLRETKISPPIGITALISLIIMPTVYEKLRVDPNTPFLIRFSLFVQHGVFWDVLLGTISKTLKVP
jgi:hypothetical protein